MLGTSTNGAFTPRSSFLPAQRQPLHADVGHFDLRPGEASRVGGQRQLERGRNAGVAEQPRPELPRGGDALGGGNEGRWLGEGERLT